MFKLTQGDLVSQSQWKKLTASIAEILIGTGFTCDKKSNFYLLPDKVSPTELAKAAAEDDLPAGLTSYVKALDAIFISKSKFDDVLKLLEEKS